MTEDGRGGHPASVRDGDTAALDVPAVVRTYLRLKRGQGVTVEEYTALEEYLRDRGRDKPRDSRDYSRIRGAI